MKAIQMLSIDAEHKSAKSNKVTTSINIYVDRRIVNSLDKEDQERVKELSEELGTLLADGLADLITDRVSNPEVENIADEFMEYVKKKAATNSDAADVYNMLKNGKW